MNSLRRARDDVRNYLNDKAYKIFNRDEIKIKEKDKNAELKIVKIHIDNNFHSDTLIMFDTNPKRFLKLMKLHKNCDFNFIIRHIDGKLFCFLIELKTTLYSDDLIDDDGVKGQIKSTFIYLYMLLRFLDLHPEFRAIIFYKNDKRSRTLPPTDIDPYIQKETDLDNNCWIFKLPNNKVKSVKFNLIQSDNNQIFNLTDIVT